MKKIDDGGPAFPQGDVDLVNNTWVNQRGFVGLSLRDHFAGLALAGMLAKYGADYLYANTAENAFNYADAMIAEKRRREGGGV